jgi:Lhr-like helicase
MFFLYWFGLFVHSLSHTRNIGHDNDKLQFIYYNTTYNICTATKYNVINNNTKFKGQLEVEFVTKSRYMCIYINISRS